MQIHLKHIRLKIDWLMLLMPFVAAALGEGYSALWLLASLTMHEAAHLCAARILHIPIHSLRLTPFGGMAQIGNPYALRAAQLCAVSAAGPLGSFLGMLTASALCHWRLIAPMMAAELILINAMLMIFNLVPALPLDGGRVLFALLSTRMSRRRAAEIGIWIGRAVSALLILLSLSGFAIQRRLNLSPIFAAIFILTSARDERRALTDSHVQTLIESLRPLNQPVPAAIVAIDAGTPPEVALRCTVPGKITLFARFQSGRLENIVDDRQLLEQLLESMTDSFEKSGFS